MKNKITLNGSNIKILVCCHKTCELPKDPDGILFPIQVGAAISDVDLGMQRDDQVNGMSCDNISAKNKSFCELSAMYWAWKNIKKIYPNLEYIGLNHYRRFFSFTQKKIFNDSIFVSEGKVRNYAIDKSKLIKCLSKRDVVMAKSKFCKFSLDVDYSVCHISEDLRTLKKIIHEKYPEFDKAVYTVMTCNNRLSPYNMNVMGWNLFNSYCTWLFDILFEVERNIDISNYNSVQIRIFGYMAERLFNIWVKHNNLNIEKLNILTFCEKKESSLFDCLSFFRASLSFLCSRTFHSFSPEYYENLIA